MPEIKTSKLTRRTKEKLYIYREREIKKGDKKFKDKNEQLGGGEVGGRKL